jgi:hypothetical protein
MILENVQSIESLIRGKEIYVCPILRSPSHHPKLNDVIALYLAVDDVGYIVPIDHPEGINVDKNILQELLDLAGKIFVFDKKEYLYFFKGKNVYDLHFGQPQSEHNVERSSESEYVTWLRHRYRSYPDLNKLVPLNILLKEYDKE